MRAERQDADRARLAGRYLIHRLFAIQAICFGLLIVFVFIDDEWLNPKLVSGGIPIPSKLLPGILDSIWVACLFAMAVYIQSKFLQKIRLLEGMLSVCANCKKIRDGKDHWSPIEEYIQKRSHADFSHTICPDCGVKLYGDLYTQAMRRAGGGE